MKQYLSKTEKEALKIVYKCITVIVRTYISIAQSLKRAIIKENVSKYVFICIIIVCT